MFSTVCEEDMLKFASKEASIICGHSLVLGRETFGHGFALDRNICGDTMALGRRICGNICVSEGSASGYEGSASFILSMKAWTLCDGDAQGFFFVSVLLPFTAHVFFLSQNAGAEWKFGDRDFCQVCYLSLNASRYSADPFANFDHQRCSGSQQIALSQKGGEAPLSLEKAAPQGNHQ